MSLNQRIFHRILFFIPIFILIIAANVSCRSGHDKELVRRDSIALLSLPQPPAITEAEKSRLNALCSKWYDSVLGSRNFSGSMIVAKDGNVIFEKYSGTQHIPGTDPVNANSSMHIASVSKTFTSMAVLKLAQEGKLNIDDEFSKYFPEFNYPGVTIRCLLNHRSGLPNYNYFMETLGWDKSMYMTNHDVLNYMITRKSELKDVANPGAHFDYCNTNYALLALLIEKVTGTAYPEHMKNTFFIPLQMKNTFVFKLADTLTAIPSYNWRGGLEPYTFLDQVYGDKNIYSTPADLLKWDRALATNLIFNNETLQQAYAPYSNERPGIRNYGLGWRLYLFPNNKKIIYHNGWWHGSNATFIRLVDENATIIVIGNRFNRGVYKAKMLTGIFGDYYNPVEEDENGSSHEALSFQSPISTSDSILKTPLPLRKHTVKRKR